MSEQPHDAYAVWREKGFQRYLIGAFCANLGRQMASVAVAWQIYVWTNSATALGLVGLLNVLPLLALSLPAGVLADHTDRRRTIAFSMAGNSLLAILLAAVSYFHESMPRWPVLESANAMLKSVAVAFERDANPDTLDFSHPAMPVIFLILLLMACLRILGWPSRASLLPLLVKPENLSSAVTWNSSAGVVATMSGPALGGFLVAWSGFSVTYLIDAAGGLLLAGFILRVPYVTTPTKQTEAPSLSGMLEGARFIWSKKVILAASSLDLFAVLLGGATALLPIYADRILHVGPVGLGWLRAAPCLGAFVMATWLAHRHPLQRPGVALLWAVVGFGLATVVFGFSTWFWLSFLALFFTGVFDNISVVVRQTLVQLLTPNHLRGRVTAMNQIFIGSSNEIGTLRAGLMAALIGPVAAVAWGGLGTILVVGAVWKIFPQLRSTAPLNKLRAE